MVDLIFRPSTFWRGAALVPALLLTLLLGATFELSAEEFSIQIVDGLRRPIPDVAVRVFCVNAKPGHETTSLKLLSAADGTVSADLLGEMHPESVSLEKAGYQSYSSGFRSRYILRRLFVPAELLRVVKLQGNEQLREFRELLSGEPSGKRGEFLRLVFYHEARLRPALRVLVGDPDVTVFVRELLATIGHSDDLRAIVRLPSPPQPEPFPERWRYSVSTALIEPDDESEWCFLRRCALNEFDDGWVDAGAIQSLMLTGSARARRVLEEARSNERRSSQIARALEYIGSNPAPLHDKDLAALVRQVASAIRIGTWMKGDPPFLNEGRDKALVDLHFQTSLDHLIYTATFHKKKDQWVVRGVQETYQGFSPSPPPPPQTK